MTLERDLFIAAAIRHMSEIKPKKSFAYWRCMAEAIWEDRTSNDPLHAVLALLPPKPPRRRVSA